MDDIILCCEPFSIQHLFINIISVDRCIIVCTFFILKPSICYMTLCQYKRHHNIMNHRRTNHANWVLYIKSVRRMLVVLNGNIVFVHGLGSNRVAKKLGA